MTHSRWRVGALATTVLLPSALLGLAPTAGYACCGGLGEEEVVISVNGTVCWEQPPPDGNPPFGIRGRTTGPSVAVTLSEPVKEPVTVLLGTEDGTAVAPDDYTAIKGLKVTVPAGARGTEVPLEIRADDKREPDEWFVVTISEPSTGKIGNGKAEVIIKDGAPPKGGGQ